MKQDPTVYCLASRSEWGCLAAMEQSGMPDLGREEESKRKKRNGQNNLCSEVSF